MKVRFVLCGALLSALALILLEGCGPGKGIFEICRKTKPSRRSLGCATLVLFALVAVTGIPAAGLHLTTSLDGMAGSHSAYLVPTFACTVQPDPNGFGMGAELKLADGLLGDTYLAGLLLFKFGYIDFGVGVSSRLVGTADPSLSYTDDSLVAACRLGITGPIWTVGPGKLGLNASLDFLATEYSPNEFKMPSVTNLGEGMVWGIMLPVYLLGYALGEFGLATVKLSAGLNYTLDF